jgi:hypothetical protein
LPVTIELPPSSILKDRYALRQRRQGSSFLFEGARRSGRQKVSFCFRAEHIYPLACERTGRDGEEGRVGLCGNSFAKQSLSSALHQSRRLSAFLDS